MSRFLTSFFRHPIATGAIAPSSKYLAHEMVSWIDWPQIRTCVEFGPGTGAFTPTILECLQPDARFLAVELNSTFAETMQRKFPDVETVNRSVAEIDAICQEREIVQIDSIICGLPWAAFSPQLQETLMDAVQARLSDQGYFCTFAYLQGTWLPAGRRFKRMLNKCFSHVTRSRIVWRNLPPAFVYQCRP